MCKSTSYMLCYVYGLIICMFTLRIIFRKGYTSTPGCMYMHSIMVVCKCTFPGCTYVVFGFYVITVCRNVKERYTHQVMYNIHYTLIVYQSYTTYTYNVQLQKK